MNTKNNLLTYIMPILIVLLLVISVTYKFITDKKNIENIDIQKVALIDNNYNNDFHITKTENEDYYYYSVTDYERNLKYSWKFLKKGNDIPVENSMRIDKDFRLNIDADTQNTKIINEKVSQKKLIISFDYHGDLPLETIVQIDVHDRFKDGEKLYLYYYNPDTNNIEYISDGVEVKDGCVSFTINHCSDYFLTGAIVNDAVNNPQKINRIIIILIVIAFALIAINLFQSKK